MAPDLAIAVLKAPDPGPWLVLSIVPGRPHVVSSVPSPPLDHPWAPLPGILKAMSPKLHSGSPLPDPVCRPTPWLWTCVLVSRVKGEKLEWLSPGSAPLWGGIKPLRAPHPHTFLSHISLHRSPSCSWTMYGSHSKLGVQDN